MDRDQPFPAPTPARPGRPPSRRALTLGLAAGALLLGTPAQALETIHIELPFLQTSFTVKVNELSSPQKLLRGQSDLAQLDRAVDGRIGRRLTELINTPLPIQIRNLVNKSQNNALAEQVQLLASTLVQVEGAPSSDDNQLLAAAMARFPDGSPFTVLSLLQAMPGRSATIDLERALRAVQRLQQQQRRGIALVNSLPAITSDPALAAPGPLTPLTSSAVLTVAHRTVPLHLDVVSPSQGNNGRLVVISHGLWDGPESFLGWADLLASHGYTVILPHHPGSDNRQQQAMLAGKAPPPSAEELRKRPLDITAVISAVGAGSIPGLNGVRSDRVVVIGHSWGATTALQLAGAQPSTKRLQKRCGNLDDPDRNLSWVLQCSFLSSAGQASLADPRVIAVAAVSPPMSLLFDIGSATGMQGRGLVISGSSDWVVPSGPEAINPFTGPRSQGHQLVLVQGGDHFNLRAPRAQTVPVLAPLLLSWTDAAFAAGPVGTRPAPGAAPLLPDRGWGSTERILVDASTSTP
jgi:predicted dienelactone hydrolase